MVLIGREHRYADQREPQVQDPPRDPAEMACIQHPQDDQQRYMQGRGLVERLVEPGEHIEHPPEESVRLRARERKGKRKREKARNRNDLRGEKPHRMREELRARRADDERYAVEQVDRPVRNDRPREERNPALPIEAERADVRAPARHPVREPIARKEERTEEAEPADRGAPRAWLRRCEVARTRYAHLFAASDTVK